MENCRQVSRCTFPCLPVDRAIDKGQTRLCIVVSRQRISPTRRSSDCAVASTQQMSRVQLALLGLLSREGQGPPRTGVGGLVPASGRGAPAVRSKLPERGASRGFGRGGSCRFAVRRAARIAPSWLCLKLARVTLMGCKRPARNSPWPWITPLKYLVQN